MTGSRSAFRKTVELLARQRRVNIRREERSHQHAQMSRRIERACVTDLPVVLRRTSGVTVLAIRLIEPARARRRADIAHRAVTALALHRQRPIRRDRRAHRAPQTTHGRTGMTLITRAAIRDVIQDRTICRIHHRRVHQARERIDARRTGRAERFRRVTLRAKDRRRREDDRVEKSRRRENHSPRVRPDTPHHRDVSHREGAGCSAGSRASRSDHSPNHLSELVQLPDSTPLYFPRNERVRVIFNPCELSLFPRS